MFDYETNAKELLEIVGRNAMIISRLPEGSPTKKQLINDNEFLLGLADCFTSSAPPKIKTP